MKTFEQILKEKLGLFCLDNYLEDVSVKSITEATQIYTEQEIKKHLAIAAEQADVDSLDYDNHVVDKHSITSIKIELT